MGWVGSGYENWTHGHVCPGPAPAKGGTCYSTGKKRNNGKHVTFYSNKRPYRRKRVIRIGIATGKAADNEEACNTAAIPSGKII